MHKPIPVNKVNLLLLSLLAFFLPWGEGMREVAGNISWVFPVLVVLLLAANRRVLLHPRSYGLFCLPPAVKWLLVFVAVHTTIYLWLNPELLAFGKSVSTTAAGGVAKVKSATGDVFLRYFLYAAFGLLLALFMRSKRCFARFWLCYGLGFTATVFLGAGLQVAGGLVRATAGYSDPNVMAMDALIVMFGSTYMLTTVRGGQRMLYGTFALVAVYAVAMSFSRGAMLAFSVCLLVWLWRMGFVKSVAAILLLAVVLALVAEVVDTVSTVSIAQLLHTRFDLEKVEASGGAHRTEIWQSYLDHWDDWWLCGTGMGNCIAVLRHNGVPLLRETHNQYLLYAVEYGVVGFLLYMRFICTALQQVRHATRQNVLLMLIALAFIVDSFFLNLDHGRSFWVVVALVCFRWYQRKYLTQRTQQHPPKYSNTLPVTTKRLND